jgi:hypothetical protein
MIKIINKETRTLLGIATEEDFKTLTDQMEEDGTGDNDYYINQTMLEYFAELGLSAELMEILKNGLGDQEEMDIEWSVGQ